jgi:methionyl-tRNA formyltransferase
MHKIYKSKKESLSDFEIAQAEIIEMDDKTIRTNKKSFWQVKTADGWLSIEEIQAEGKKRLPIEDFLRGYRW